MALKFMCKFYCGINVHKIFIVVMLMLSHFSPKNSPNIQNIVCEYCIIPYMVMPNTVLLPLFEHKDYLY